MTSPTPKKTIFFDRDGTLIIDKVYLNDPEQIIYLPGVFEALAKLRDAGFQFIMVTNQSGIAKGIISMENFNEIQRRIAVEFAKHDISFLKVYFAPYASDSDHQDRKPNPGMLLQGATEFAADLNASWMIGDRMSDVEAGHRAGCRTVLLEGADQPSEFSWAPPTFIARDVTQMADFILNADRSAR